METVRSSPHAAAWHSDGTPANASLLELAEACDVPVRWACRTGVCHTCETALMSGTVAYNPDITLENTAGPTKGPAAVCPGRRPRQSRRPEPKTHRTRLTGRMANAPMMAQSPATPRTARRSCRCRSPGWQARSLARSKREEHGDVEHTEILGGAVPVGQHVHHERQVDGHVHTEAEPADGHADQETAEVAGDGDHEQRQAVYDRRGQDEDFPSARPSETFPPMRDAATITADWASVPRNICCGTSALAVPILSSRHLAHLAHAQLLGSEGSSHDHHVSFTCSAFRRRLIEPEMPSAFRGSGGDLR